MKLFLLSTFILLLFQQNSAQNTIRDPFILEVVNAESPNQETPLCYGTIISSRHILTAATCVSLAQRISVRYYFGSTVYQAERISIHPNYRRGQQGNFNAAVIHVNTRFLTTNLPLLPIQRLPTNDTCNLFGWGQESGIIPRNEEVLIYDSEFCHPEFPQVSCSTFESTNHPTCAALVGSPVLCEDNTRFTGFKTSVGCSGTRNLINYQSVNTFRTWYDEIVQMDVAGNPHFVANVMEFLADNIGSERTRCAGTIITDNHVLTAATCATLPENSQLVIGVQSTFDGLGFATVQSEQVFIHPDFASQQNGNIAVIKISSRFVRMNNQPPLPLGELPTTNATDENLCQIVSGNPAEILRRNIVAVYRPQLCRENLPQVFCSFIDIGSQETCSAAQGSPVICGGNIAGVLLSNRVCGQIGGMNALDFHSVGEFREWIDEVSGAGKLAATSTILILSALLMFTKNFL